jgi:hypothetical protein
LSKLAAAWSEIQETIILRCLANLLNNTSHHGPNGSMDEYTSIGPTC